MSDLSNWEADHPGVSPEWWRARNRYFPMRAWKAFEHFHDRLWVYRNRQTEEHLHDVRMVGLGGDQRLAAEALPSLDRGGRNRPQDLEGDRPAQHQVEPEEHPAHAALRDLPHDFVPAVGDLREPLAILVERRILVAV